MALEFKDLLEVGTKRRATKQYNPESRISQEDLDKIFEFTNTAPTSMGIENWRVLNIDRDSEHRQFVTMQFLGSNMERAYMASNIVLFISKKGSYFDENNEELRAKAKRSMLLVLADKGEEYTEGAEDWFFDRIVNYKRTQLGLQAWDAKQAYIAMGYMLIAAASVGVETTPIEGYNPNLNDYLEEHKLINEDETVSIVMLMGYVDEVDNPFIGDKQVRIPTKDKFKNI